MFTGKILKKTAPHGLTFGEQWVNLEIDLVFSNQLEKMKFYQIATLLMRNPGYSSSASSSGLTRSPWTGDSINCLISLN